MKSIKNYLHLIILAIPLLPILVLFSQYPWSDDNYHQLIHLSGEMSVRLLILTLMITPFLMLFPQNRFWKWMRRHRKEFGLISFFYLLIHISIYCLHLPKAMQLLKDFYLSTYFAGWIAFVLMCVLALTSHNYFLRKLGYIYWKNIQRSVYVVAFLSAMHWLLKEKIELLPVLVHFIPLMLLEFMRVKKLVNQKFKPIK